MYEPTHKKRKLSPENDSDSSEVSASSYDEFGTQQILAEEFDLEIALRQRLAATIESRMTWALILQEALTNEIPASPSANFEDAATEVLQAVESPCNVLFDRDPRPCEVLQELLDRSAVASVTSEFLPQPKPLARKSRPSRVRSQVQPTKLLFIRDTTVFPPTIAKMVCPDCGRSDFTNLQGLLNHARLSHKREYGSHDACMRSCAVLVEDGNGVGEADWVLKHGTELAGVSIPSLRRLFEIAVGDDSGVVNGFEAGAEEDDEDAVVVAATHLSKTLGYHKDTPALAPFLGRAPKRRCINVYDEDENVDVGDSTVPSKPSWRMSFPHRNKARPEFDVVAETTLAPKPSTRATPAGQYAAVSLNAGTRFHVTARIVVSDRSVWIPPERRGPKLPDHTHSWSLGVDSPSYSLHISTFLTNMTVMCLTDPSPSTISTPLSVVEPPFVVSGTTDRPFLAKISLTWAGPKNAPMDVEHWVELDPYHNAVHPVLGDEQILDVELDRHTELMPIRGNDTHSTRRRNVNEPFRNDEDSIPLDSSQPDDPYYIIKLKSLLPRYPMTLKDIKGRLSLKHIPYKLVSTPAQLRGLIAGRRIAIEWGRARALRDAYQAVVVSEPPERAEDAIALTTADVFCWLEDEGHFVRPVTDAVVINAAPPAVKNTRASPARTASLCALCSVCGQSHQQVPAMSADGVVAGCIVVRDQTNLYKMPMVDVRHPLGLLFDAADERSTTPYSLPPGRIPKLNSMSSTSPDPSSTSTLSMFSARDLVATASPDFTMAIRRMVQPLLLPSFNQMASERLFLSPDNIGETRSQVEAQLAPYALMASLTKIFIGLLVRSGLDTANLDVATLKAKSQGRNTRKTKQPRDRLLTPSHILRSLAGGSKQPGHLLAATSLCLSRFGVGVSNDHRKVVMTTRDRVPP